MDGSLNQSYPQETSEAEQGVEIVNRIFRRLRTPGKRDFANRLWNGETLPADGGGKPRFTIVLNHPGALRRMFVPPGELTLGEAFLRGDFDIEGDIVSGMNLAPVILELTAGDWLYLARQVLSLPRTTAPTAYEAGRAPARVRGLLHSRERDRAAVRYHYNAGNEFYALFLGKWMTYSCAYFADAALDLDGAQEAKLDYLCRKLQLQAGDRLLDIGCGWGGLVVYAAEKYGVEATGINLSEPQVDYANDWIKKAGVADRARVEIRDYRDLDSEMFDKVVSVGMFEHVGRARMAEYFESVFRVLRPGGLFLNHGIAAQFEEPNWIRRNVFQEGLFSPRYVFPDGELMPVSEAMVIAEQVGFELRDLESLREHYALTLRHWVRNLEANHEKALALKNERTYRVWRFYMAAAVVGFELGHTSVFQALLSKSRRSKAELPLTRAGLYV